MISQLEIHCLQETQNFLQLFHIPSLQILSKGQKLKQEKGHVLPHGHVGKQASALEVGSTLFYMPAFNCPPPNHFVLLP